MTKWLGERLNATRISRCMKNFNKFISTAELTDPPMSNGEFTWSRMGERVAASRIDRFLISNLWGAPLESSKLKDCPDLPQTISPS